MPTGTKAVRVGIPPLGEIVVEPSKIRILDAAGGTRSELDADTLAARAIPVRVFVEADIVEVFVNDRHCLVARLPTRQGDRRLTLRSEGTEASVRAVRISALDIPSWLDKLETDSHSQ
jgi:sucrose-6-phosphate hydrolase SacC (GH32 family)